MADPSGCIYDEDRGYAIHTWTGKAFFPFDIRPEDVCIDDIAHGLSMVCRYGGQSDAAYSVAQHSVYCYFLAIDRGLSLDLWREALLHDAVEAYMGVDFPRPYKLMLPALVAFENTIEQQLNPILGIPVHKSPEIKNIDETMLATEIPLMFQSNGTYTRDSDQFVYNGEHNIMAGLPDRLDWKKINHWTQKSAEEMFLECWDTIQRCEKAAA